MNGYRISDLVKKYTQYNMIQAYTELPDYPERRTQLLYTFLQKGCESERSELYSLVTSLVQMGLDTHELVDTSTIMLTERQSRSRQLKVLAGDYFSSRFYYLLSREGHIGMVKHLSGAICEVNRLKINLYQIMLKLKMTAEEYYKQTVAIQSHLFLSFALFMDEAYRDKWADILYGFTGCEVILHEIDHMESDAYPRFSWAFCFISQTVTKEEKKIIESDEEDTAKLRYLFLKYKVKDQLYHLLEQQVKLLLSKVDQLDSQKMIKELYQIGMPFMRYLTAHKVL